MITVSTLWLAATVVIPPSVPQSDIAPDTTIAQRVAIARTLLRHDERAEGFATYLDAAERVTAPADWQFFARDLAWIATPAELTAWQATPDAGRPAFIRAFWSGRDARDGLPAGGRLATQVHRLDVAMVRYRIAPRRGIAPVMRASAGSEATFFGSVYGAGSPLRDYLPSQGAFDDRGAIYIRHGDPAVVTIGAGNRLESWTYEIEGQPRTVHFTDAAFDGSNANGTLIAVVPRGAWAGLCQTDPIFCGPAARPGGLPPEQAQRLREASLAAIRLLTSTDDAHPPAS
jgi:hypothetical protein